MINLRNGFFLYVLAYRLFLDLVYIFVISPRFSYSGLIYKSSVLNSIISWFTLLIFYIAIRSVLIYNGDRISFSIVSILFFVSFIPFTTCISVGLVNWGFIIFNSVYWFVLIIGMILIKSIPVKPFARFSFSKIKIDKRFITLVGIASLLLVLYISWRYTHFRLNFSLYDVYDLRMEARTYSFPRIVAYLFSWTLAINPILFGLCLIKKDWFMASIYFIVQMLSFGVDGLKSTFFMPFIVALCIYFFKSNDIIKLKKIIILCLTILAILGLLEAVIHKSTYLSDIGIRRMLFIPNQLGEYYFDFFSKNEPDLFRSSFLRYIGIQSPYTTDGFKGFTYIIGWQYFGKSTMNCNNGLSSDAMANFGIFGCVIMPILLIISLHLFDRSTINVNKKLSIISGIYIAYILLSTTLTTVLLTHGLLLLMLLMSIIGNDNTNKE